MRRISLILISALIISFASAGCQAKSEVSISQLTAQPEKYNGNTVTVEGFYFHGFETVVLCESLTSSGYAPGHLIPSGATIWVNGGLTMQNFERLYMQQMMGPTERFGKVRITGVFEYGGQYGHVGAFKYQITPEKVELLD